MTRKALGKGLSALFTQTSQLESELIEIAIDQLDPTADQPRQSFRDDRLDELARSMKTSGVLQPLVVRRNGERFQIIAGERRWRAAQRAGLHRVPCIVKSVPEESMLEISLIENIQREELTPIEEARAFRKLIDQLHVTQEEVAQRVGKDRSTITNSLRLLKLPSEIQRLVEEEKLSMGHARALLALESPEQQISIAARVINHELSVRETERLVKQIQERAEGKQTKRAKAEDPNVRAAESKLSKRLEAPVKIKFGKEGGVIEIKFSSGDDLSRLFDLMVQSSQGRSEL
ncbi:MAG TPA: ParB/RepB/Spo0J family partition protein [Blastocatellia bacterium]|jgi:ParB family chromosome partitioning protein